MRGRNTDKKIMMASLSQGREGASFPLHPRELGRKGIEGRTGKVPVEQRELTSKLLHCLLLVTISSHKLHLYISIVPASSDHYPHVPY